MTVEQVKQFYREVGDVCIKHNISGVAGVWFSGEGHDEFGQLQFHDIADSRMGALTRIIAEMYNEWAKVAIKHTPKPIGNIHEVRRPDNETAGN